jgi:Mannosyltransferase putative/Methyltransferase domain
VFTCALHGKCTIDAEDHGQPTAHRSCAACADYLPREPFGPNSAQMRRQAEEFLASLPPYPRGRYQGRGVVMVGGGERFFPSLYVSIRALRHVGCRLPIQVWYLGRRKEMPARNKALLAGYDVQFVDGDQVRRRHPARCLDGWELKVFAALNSPFEELLFLDADCYPCRNPAFLFERDDYRARGAVFWADIHAVDPQLRWAAYGVPDPRRLGSIESGQFVLHKRLSWQPLNLAWYYNDHSDFYYRYGYGDKHTFEAAWARCARPFVMWQPVANWVQVAYVHAGPDRRPLFVHRCCDKFRFDNHCYTTTQCDSLPLFCSTLPLERECWGWLAELARLTGRRVPDAEVAMSAQRARTSLPSPAPLRTAVFDVSRYLYGPDPWLADESPEDVRRCYEWKFRLAQLLQPRRILEIGVRFGYSAAAFLAAAPGAAYYGVDADNGAHGGILGAYQKARLMLKKEFPKSRIKIAKLDTRQKTPEGSGYELVHVDGDHTHQGCLNDLRLAARLGKRWVLIDDIHHPRCPGVARAVKDFLAETGLPHIYFDETFRGDCLIRLPDAETGSLVMPDLSR